MKTAALLLFFFTTSIFFKGTEKYTDFDWILGNWKYEESETTYEEHWTKVDGSTYQGRAFSTAGSDTVSKEYFRISKIDSDWLFSAETDQGKTVSTFFLTEKSNNKLVFRKRDDSFPKQINYQGTGNTQLKVWIEGELNGRFMKFEYPMTKIPSTNN